MQSECIKTLEILADAVASFIFHVSWIFQVFLLLSLREFICFLYSKLFFSFLIFIFNLFNVDTKKYRIQFSYL